MIDAILYVADYPALAQYLSLNHPELLRQTDQGEIRLPPVIDGFARTKSVQNGSAVLAYARFREAQAAQWRGIPGIEILGEAEFTGRGTADAVYGQVFDDPDKLAKYDSVYDRTPREVDDGQGGVITVTPPDRFGVVAGA
ncbi:hypothetical protein [Halomonas elongata]|uniref:Uncharacterized protein n=1 Tax=Halomonas elongata (strain ATCC 33173 / DSM 2581 / NBRC 15536 / NCIMB 2198 / 1H9) TaxID=768066 RepID=E1VAV3_HALED|nr:hypothetical protein [Halomonas elongata]WBF17806.1 hypothetical protein LM502_17340 [Halomonas elongata]WPU46651.1 hypothetical protein SR933_15590 [Halomonas elongata DSM 2581]CBV44052.1 uncharacterized protein HELO_4168 [Halomonas elongata DSM 2581]